jgi:hypothetical protein
MCWSWGQGEVVDKPQAAEAVLVVIFTLLTSICLAEA